MPLLRALGAAVAAGVVLQPAAGQAEPPSRALLDRYCVTCHNERLKTGGVMFDQVDISRVAEHRELLEKVVRKLRSGQMPPDGRPRPERPAVIAFVTALEAELDKAGAAAPNPGRVASHRLNRTQYVNAVRDLLDLEIDGEALLPSDMAGFGFDNNADVLAMTPALMDRYITAATKVSRLAVGTLENRPAIRTYRLPSATRQDARMGEDLPFATHGGLAARHTFALDGDYLFKIRLERGDVGGTIRGNIAERVYHIELRIDHALMERLTVGGEFEGQVEYTLTGGGIAPPDDDLVHQRIALYNQTADQDLEVRLPVQAGTRLVSAAFTNVAPSASVGVGDNMVAGIASLEIHGTVRRQGPRGDTWPRAYLRLPAGRPPGRGAVRQDDRQHPGPPRVPAAGHGRRPAPVDGDLRDRPRGRGLRDRRGAGAGSAAQHARVPHARRGRPARRPRRDHLPHQRPGAGVAAGRLPVEEHSGRRAAGRGGARRAARSGRAGAADAAHAR